MKLRPLLLIDLRFPGIVDCFDLFSTLHWKLIITLSTISLFSIFITGTKIDPSKNYITVLPLHEMSLTKFSQVLNDFKES